MFALILILVFGPRISSAAPAWLHLVAKDQTAHVRVTEDLDAMLGPQRAFRYEGLETDGDYIFDDARIDAVLGVLRANAINDFRIRHPAAQLGEWFDDSVIEQSPTTPTQDKSVIEAAYRMLRQLDRLVNLVKLNDEGKERSLEIPDGNELQRCAQAMARDIIQRLGKAHRAPLDVFILTHGQSFEWAARDLLARNDDLLRRYLAEVGYVIKSNRRNMREFSRHHRTAAKWRWRTTSIDLGRLGVKMGDAATDQSADNQINHLLEHGIGVALLRLSNSENSVALISIENSVRSWYPLIEAHVAARTDAARFDRFGTAMDQAIARRAWAIHRAGKPWPADLVAAYAQSEGVNLETSKNFLTQRATDLDGGVMRVDGDLVFEKFMADVAYGGQMVSDAYPGDRERLRRYYLGITKLFSRLIATDPPSHPATHLTLLDTATSARAEIRRLLGPEEFKRGELGEEVHSLRRLVIARSQAFDLEDCQANLSRRGLIPALRRATGPKK